MKRNDYTEYTKGQEISGVTFQQHQNQVIESINSVMLALGLDTTQLTILWGIEECTTDPACTVSAGAVFFNGEIFEVDAYTGTAGSYPSAYYLRPVTQSIGDDITFVSDGSTKAVHLDHKYTIALGSDSSTGEVALNGLQRMSDYLNAYTDQSVAALIDGETTLDTFAKVATELQNLERLRGSGGSSVSNGATLDHTTDSGALQEVFHGSNKTTTFPGASIPASDLTVVGGTPRRVLAFFSMLVDKEGGTEDDVNIHIKYRVGGGTWTTLRIYHLKLWQPMHLDLKAPVEFAFTPAGNVEFALEFERLGGDSFMVSADNYIAFDYWIN